MSFVALSSSPWWVLPLLVFLVWIGMIVAAAGDVYRAHRRSGRAGPPPGVSILPGFPSIPLLAWALALGLDSLVPPWGTLVVGGLHVLLGSGLLLFAVVSWRQ
jgi:hypothetical protein